MSLYEKFQDEEWATWAIRNSARDALIKHKALGVAIAIWKDGQPTLIPPEDIEIPEAMPRPPRKNASVNHGPT